MNEMNVKTCQKPVIPASERTPIKGLMSDIADLTNKAYAMAGMVSREILGVKTPENPNPVDTSLQEALIAHRAVLAALCDRLDVLIQGLGVQ